MFSIYVLFQRYAVGYFGIFYNDIYLDIFLWTL